MKSLPPNSRLFDTHCHIDLFPNPSDIVAEAARLRIGTIAVTNAPFLFEHTQQLCRKSEYVVPALGLHPELVHSHGQQIEQFRELLPLTRFVGEVGLDYVTKDQANRQRQREVFETILRWCSDAGDKILTVHSRRSSADVIAAIGANFCGVVILHWFSGSLRELHTGIDNGYLFSVNPAMTRSEQGLRLIRDIPKDRLLTETDGPFVAVERAQATPSATEAVCSAVAEIWNCSGEEVQDTVRQNVNRAMGRETTIRRSPQPA